MLHVFVYVCRFPVTEEMVKPFLQELSLQDAMTQSRIFIVDHAINKGIPTKQGFVVRIVNWIKSYFI